jgi:glucosamine-6-phosphate deaminase
VGINTSYFIEGDSADVQAECKRLENMLSKYTVDVAFTGIGENGHLAFNDPPANFDDDAKFKVVALDERSRKQQLGEGWFQTLDDVPKQAITMTIPAIVASKAIICTVPELRKAEAVRNILSGPVSPDFPASILRKHPHCTLFLDHHSSSLLDF